MLVLFTLRRAVHLHPALGVSFAYCGMVLVGFSPSAAVLLCNGVCGAVACGASCQFLTRRVRAFISETLGGIPKPTSSIAATSAANPRPFALRFRLEISSARSRSTRSNPSTSNFWLRCS
ncbi:hypothetical protein K402DRAFT_159337 [Aulographum hederae CBS 113979]|uniref:Uncharacterized protein n=1 Tax=Aulographum hederae CBS 113979 TaxID=1176131 RepID=A0A6G1GRP0_9PEZI|nr:hypothetical protein K402DRAFT_159337 [Aulographum hederae CBS 113979]